MTRLLALLVLIAATPALAQMDVDCLVEAHSRYVETHNRLFREASDQLARTSPDHHKLVSDFVDYQTRSNTLKAYVVAFIAARAPTLLNTRGSIARIVPQHGEGTIHHLMMRDSTYRDYYPEWRRQTRRYIQREGYSEKEWQRFVVARSELNRIMGTLAEYPDVLKAFSWPVAEFCRVR